MGENNHNIIIGTQKVYWQNETNELQTKLMWKIE